MTLTETKSASSRLLLTPPSVALFLKNFTLSEAICRNSKARSVSNPAPVPTVGCRPSLSSSWSAPAANSATPNAAWASPPFVYNRMVANDQATRDSCLWLTPHELEKEFNAVNQANLSLGFVTEVSNFAAQGACRYDHNARSCWLNNLKVLRPVFRRKNRIGTGSFLAASGVGCIRYDGHRRVRLPYLGNVSMTRPLQDGVADEVAIRNGNGRWYASIGCLQPAMAVPQRETQSVGGVYVGINALAVDSNGVEYQNPKGSCRAPGRLKRWQRAQARRTPDSRGGQVAQRRIDGAHRWVVGLRDNVHHHVSRALVGKYHTMGTETLNVAGMIRAGLQSRALADAGVSGLLNQIRAQGPVARHPHCGSRPVVSPQQDLRRLRCGEQRPRLGAPLAVSQLRRNPRPQPERSS